MANMNVNQRTQYDRPDLSVPSTGIHVRSKRALVVYTVLASLLLAALAVVTIVTIDGWAQGVVLAVIVLTTIGAMIALSPKRRY